MTKNKKIAWTKIMLEKFLKYTKMTKNGKIVSRDADIKPVKGYLFSLWEYNQILNIYDTKNKAAFHETKNPEKTPTIFKKK